MLRRHFSVLTRRMFNPFSAATVFICQNVTLQTPYSDVCRRQILTHKDGPRTGRINRFLVTHNIGIEMNQKEL